MTITEGIHNISEAVYHADPCPQPSLSNGIATLMLGQSPLHARHAHPRLTEEKAEPREITQAMDFGSALHKLLLGKGAEITVIPHADYKKAEARELREEAREAGRIPILEKANDRLQAAANAALRQMRAHPDCADFFAPGQSEAVMAWQEGDVWCRSMVDRMPDNPRAPLFDLKATEMSAAPGAWERRLAGPYLMQAPFYGRGSKRLRGHLPPPMRFVVVEMRAPYAISVMCQAPSLYDLGRDEVERAIRLWGYCMRTNQWPGYPAFTAHIEAPAWRLNAAEDRALREEFMEQAA